MSRVPSHLREMLKPQEDFELLREDTLKRFGPRLCDLSYANAQDSAPDSVRNAIISAVQSSRASDFQYSPYGGATIARRLAAQALSTTAGLRFSYRDVVLVPGAMSALNLVLQALKTGRDEAPPRSAGALPIDEAVVITPCWLDYPLYLANHGYRMRKAPVDSNTLRLDLAAIEAQLGPNTRVVMLSQPANPAGICYRAEELAALGALLERQPNKPVLISDECHRDYVYATELASPALHYANTCVVYSIGKKLLMQGQRIGYVAVSPRMENAEVFREDLVTWTRISGMCTPTALMQRALGTLLEVGAPLGDVARRAKRLTGQLREAGYEVVEPDSTFFVYPKVPGDDFAFARKLARLGVLVLPAAVFHHSGHVRLSVTATDDVIERALPLLRQALTEEAA